MKKIILMMMAMFSMTMVMAENEDNTTTNSADAYTLNVNFNRLAEALQLTDDQKDAVEEIHTTFVKELMLAGQASGEEREAMVDRIVKLDVRYMSYVLERDQYRKYLMLLNLTLHNRGIR